MRKTATMLILVLMSSLALALPAPRDIEAAVKAGQLPQAETMLHQVIQEKPGSAKAHYELGQVLAREGRTAEARAELLEAQKLDPALKFAKDPQHFRDLLNRLPAATPASPAARSPEVPKPAAPAPASTGASFPWTYVLFGGFALLLIWLVIRRLASASRPPLATAGSRGLPVSGGGYGYGPGGAYGGPGYGTPPSPPPPSGSGIGGAVLGGLAGLAAGYGLSRVLEHGDEGRQPSSAHRADDNGFIPIDNGSQADYGSFDSGSGSDDSWDAGDSDSGGDNNW